ncbi:precorrin-2/cobalt-factor-2 C20-methyltransferase [Anaerosolibacter carboniphilus]|uniref:Precorrin-2/cobalt-factor-2 C20-methyltransferase n=1 Tax=Anaerosolibacter carboniphilus TaxID=1417629 RepID=A0A841KMC7_9FIRM|nr:precorrin-2 C(20)-methyltransferase [Anaerosolibacter carboniphilus]MBB6214597.1 precorrin-2/cobalt-factor-2 C20-methyltransferase [Anaerosolibacter carboniphilus]
MNGRFYGLGVGPGDPELVTLKAIHILNQVDIIIAPETIKDKGSVAYDIIKGHVQDQRKVVFQVFPMTYDSKELDASWNRNMEEILTFLFEGKNVAFITLGDPMVYSTYIYVMRLIRDKGIAVETVPGITSFCAAASRLGIPLSEGNETIAIVPAAYQCEQIDDILHFADNVILMKPSRGFEKTVQKLEEHQLLENTVLISKCGHEDEKISYDVKSLLGEKIDYLSMLIAKKRRQK